MVRGNGSSQEALELQDLRCNLGNNSGPTQVCVNGDMREIFRRLLDRHHACMKKGGNIRILGHCDFAIEHGKQ